MLRRLMLLLSLMILSGAAAAQNPRNGSGRALNSDGEASIRGVVVLPDGSALTEAVKITLKILRGDQAMTYTDQEGRFEFLHVAAGEYTIEVEADRDRRRFEILNEKIVVRRNTPAFVTLSLKEKRADDRSPSEKTVSVAVLDQKVPSAAKREFDQATRFAGEGKSQESIEALQRAVAIYPDYLMALNNLGAQLLEIGRLDEAATSLRAAVRIDPNAFNPHLNLGILLVRQNKFVEALSALDKALSLEPSAPAAHLYTGLATFANDTSRAERELKAAYDLGGLNFAVALVHLGKLYMKLGDKQSAVNALEMYLLAAPDGPNAPQVRQMLTTLH